MASPRCVFECPRCVFECLGIFGCYDGIKRSHVDVMTQGPGAVMLKACAASIVPASLKAWLELMFAASRKMQMFSTLQ